jgi:alpha-beta hydrolase superfamily lysophospholipase
VAYANIMATRPQTMYGLADSPVDLAAFMLDHVAPLLAAAGYRVIVPHLRGHGTTRFRRARPSGTASSR